MSTARDLDSARLRPRPASGPAPRTASDDGMTLAEIAVTMLVFAVVIAITLGIISSLSQQSVNLHDSTTSAQQEITAGEALEPYTHSALQVVVNGSSSTTDLFGATGALPTSKEFEYLAYSGFNYSAAAGTPSCVLVDAKWYAPTTTGGSATFKIATVPANCSTGIQISGAPVTVVGTYAALGSPSTAVFKYLNASGTAITPNAPCTSQEVYAVIVNVTFLSGPQKARQGFSANRQTTLYTEIYFQPNSATTTTNPATTTTTVASCS